MSGHKEAKYRNLIERVKASYLPHDITDDGKELRLYWCDACKEINGYSMAWFHHRGRNYHHYEMWQDDFDHGGKPLLMPYKYFAEMVCDYLAAGRAYQGKNFSFKSELEWWEKKREYCAMPENQVAMLDHIFTSLANHEASFNNDGVCGTDIVDNEFVHGYGHELIARVYENYAGE